MTTAEIEANVQVLRAALAADGAPAETVEQVLDHYRKAAAVLVQEATE